MTKLSFNANDGVSGKALTTWIVSWELGVASGHDVTPELALEHPQVRVASLVQVRGDCLCGKYHLFDVLAPAYEILLESSVVATLAALSLSLIHT